MLIKAPNDQQQIARHKRNASVATIADAPSCLPSTPSSQIVVASKGKPISCFINSIHNPGLGINRSQLVCMERIKYGNASPDAAAINTENAVKLL